MNLNGIISIQNGDEHLGAKDVTIKKKILHLSWNPLQPIYQTNQL